MTFSKKISIATILFVFGFFVLVFGAHAAEPTLTTTLPNTFSITTPVTSPGDSLDFTWSATNIPAGEVLLQVGFFNNTNNSAELILNGPVGVGDGYLSPADFQNLGAPLYTVDYTYNNPSVVTPNTQNIPSLPVGIQLNLINGGNPGNYAVIAILTGEGLNGNIATYGQTQFQIGNPTNNQNQGPGEIQVSNVNQTQNTEGGQTVNQILYTISGSGFGAGETVTLHIDVYGAQNVAEISNPNTQNYQTLEIQVTADHDGNFETSVQTFTVPQPAQGQEPEESFIITSYVSGGSYTAAGNVEFDGITNDIPHTHEVVFINTEEVVNAEGSQQQNNNQNSSGSSFGNCQQTNGVVYCLLEPIGSGNNRLTAIDQDTDLGDYLSLIFRMGIAIAGILAVLMIVAGGFKYMTTESFTGKSDAKDTIVKAIGGVILALAAWLILNSIDPNLVDFTIGLTSITPQQYEAVTGNPPPSSTEVSQLAAAAAATAGVNECVASALLQMESNSNPLAIGHDENRQNLNTSSYQSFRNSSRFYSGQSKEVGFFQTNDDSFDSNQPHLGLDWRGSHGIGLLQITFFPQGWGTSNYINNPPDWNTRLNTPTRQINGTTYTPAQVLDAETNLAAGLGLWATNYNSSGNIQQAFAMYNGGTNPGPTAQQYAQQAMNHYNSCIGG